MARGGGGGGGGGLGERDVIGPRKREIVIRQDGG